MNETLTSSKERSDKLLNEMREAMERPMPVVSRNIALADELVLYAEQVFDQSKKLLSRAQERARYVRELELHRDKMKNSSLYLSLLLIDEPPKD
jgi:hypothetical protein